jgi:DNA-binding response OmpR family regulator/two-component sensor histidine kinase
MDNKAIAKENIGLVKKNALRLLRLINQLMDFRKIEEKKMILRVSEMDVVQFVKETMTAFESLASKRKIDFRLSTSSEQVYAWFDPNMLDKVIFNLLSNAFKFTNDKGKIDIHIDLDQDRRNVLIFVEDNGIGMSKDFSEHAFDRFHTDGSYGGTGIGLSLSKEFLEAHKGDLILSSEKGKGTRFCVVLPLGNAHFEPEQLIQQSDWMRNTAFDSLVHDHTATVAQVSKLTPTKDYTILIIDDNAELRVFLKKRLEEHYNVYEASDGATGLRQAKEVVPDVVICDVMLPNKDGFEITRELKEDRSTSHIPVIILTAKGSIEQRIAGAQTGADEYITKPFVFEYLHERIKSLIRSRESLKEHYSHDIAIDLQSNTPGSLDKRFINEFIAQIEKNISNTEFNVNDIGRELGMSRVQVYRKVKALLGFSVNDYIINVRLKKAKALLLETDKTIADISSEVGFSSPTYFSTTFKAKVHMSPKEFKLSQSASQ